MLQKKSLSAKYRALLFRDQQELIPLTIKRPKTYSNPFYFTGENFMKKFKIKYLLLISYSEGHTLFKFRRKK